MTGDGVMLAKGDRIMNPIFIAKTSCRASEKSTLRVFAITAGAALLLIAGATTSCGTTRGFGRDVEKTGEKIQNAAR